jgi:carboxymethylenebutenolidase
VAPAGATFADPAAQTIVRGMAGTLNPTTHVTDARAFVAVLDSQQAVDRTKKIGTSG